MTRNAPPQPFGELQMNNAVLANVLSAVVIVSAGFAFAYSVKNDVSVLQTSVNIKFEYVARDIQELKEWYRARNPTTQPAK